MMNASHTRECIAASFICSGGALLLLAISIMKSWHSYAPFTGVMLLLAAALYFITRAVA